MKSCGNEYTHEKRKRKKSIQRDLENSEQIMHRKPEIQMGERVDWEQV